MVRQARRNRVHSAAPPEAERYKTRSGAERCNARLKDEFGARHVQVRGHAKVTCHLMLGGVALERAVKDVTRMEGAALKSIMRTGTVASTDNPRNRNWELLTGMANHFYRERVDQHLRIGIRAVELLREQGINQLHSRKLRSFAEVAFQ